MDNELQSLTNMTTPEEGAYHFFEAFWEFGGPDDQELVELRAGEDMLRARFDIWWPIWADNDDGLGMFTLPTDKDPTWQRVLTVYREGQRRKFGDIALLQ